MITALMLWVAATAFGVRIAVDVATLQRIRSGDAAAIKTLVERHHSALVGLAQTIVKSRAVAEDVVQETWIAVLTHIKTFDGRSSLSTWIIAILLNKAKTYARREGRYVGLAEEGDGSRDDDTASPLRFRADGHWAQPPESLDGMDPERIVAGRVLWQHVRGFIEELAPSQRAVVILRDVEGKDAAETCRLLEISPENQRILLHRGRTKIRHRLEALVRG